MIDNIYLSIIIPVYNEGKKIKNNMPKILDYLFSLKFFKTKEKSFDISVESSKIYTPKIISKFPPIDNNFNKINDELVINHCFPNNLSIKEGKKYSDYIYHFEFELDNKIYNLH